MEISLVAPCGINCNICSAYLRKKKPCPGCPEIDQSIRRCIIIKCEARQASKSGYCYECSKFPCRRIRQIDERYRRQVDISNIENLETIRDKGVSYLLKTDKTKWQCPECGGVISNNGTCYNCGFVNDALIKRIRKHSVRKGRLIKKGIRNPSRT